MQALLNFFDPKHYDRFSPDNIPENIRSYMLWPFQTFKLTFPIVSVFFAATFLVEAFDVTAWWLLMIFFFLGFGTILVVCYNILFLALFIIFAIADRKYGWLILQKASVMLLNVPVTLLYLYLLSNI